MSATPEETPVFVRVETESGAKVSVSAAYAEAQGLKALKDDAVTPGGKPLPATYPETKAAKKAASSSGQA